MKSSTKNISVVFMLFCTLASASFANSFGLFDSDRSWIGIQSGSNTNFYSVWNGGTGNLNGSLLNSSPFTSASDSLLARAFDIKTFKNGNGDVFGGTFFWTVYETGNRSNISFNSVALGFLQDLSSGNQKWGFTNQSINLLTAAPVSFSSGPKSYTFEIYTQINGVANGSNSSVFDNNNNAPANYSATFTTIPEPTSATLFALSAAGLLALRRRRNA